MKINVEQKIKYVSKTKFQKGYFVGLKKCWKITDCYLLVEVPFWTFETFLIFFSLTFIFILSTNYAWFCCILAWNIMLMHFNSSSNYRIIYRHSSTYAVFWDSTKPCKQKTVLLEKWFSTKTPKWDSQLLQSPLF